MARDAWSRSEIQKRRVELLTRRRGVPAVLFELPRRLRGPLPPLFIADKIRRGANRLLRPLLLLRRHPLRLRNIRHSLNDCFIRLSICSSSYKDDKHPRGIFHCRYFNFGHSLPISLRKTGAFRLHNTKNQATPVLGFCFRLLSDENHCRHPFGSGFLFWDGIPILEPVTHYAE